MPSLKFDMSDIAPLVSSLGLGQSPDTTFPDRSKITPPPMAPPAPLPPTPAAAGFLDWKNDPQNQQKVTSGMTPPNTPIIPAPVPLNPFYGFVTPPNLAPPSPRGLVTPGNVNVYNRPIVPNGRDSSTVRSVSFGLDNGETLVPSVSDGEDGRKPHLLSIQPSPNDGPSEALSYYRRYGKSLGTFANPEDADAYGQALHLQQAGMQNFGGRTAQAPMIHPSAPPAPPTLSTLPPMPFLNPPQKQYASLNPPNMPAPVSPVAPPASTALLPYQPLKGAAPTTINAPGTQTEAEYFAANPSQQARKQFSGGGLVQNILNGVAAGTLGAAGGLKGNPSAGAEYVAQGAARDANVPEVNNSRYRAAVVQPQIDAVAAQQAQANLGRTQAQTADIGAKRQQDYAKLGLKETTNPDGSTALGIDPDSPVTKANKDKDAKLQQQTDLIGAQIDSTKAQKELRDAQTAYNQAKTDPNSPLFKQTAQRLAIAQQNAGAAQTRAQAYMGNYLKGAYNKGLDGGILPGSPQIADDNGNITTPGATNAPLAVKVNANAAQFNDVHGALDNLEQTATNLVQKGGKINSPGVVAALSQPSGTLGKWLQGAGIKANLSPEERAYVQSVAAAHENIQALRKSAGGTATDSAVEKLDQLIPNASTPDLNYLKGQTSQIRQTAERLGKGAATASGGLSIKGQKGITAPPTGGGDMISVQIPGQAPGQIHASQKAAFLAKYPNAKVN